MDFSGPEAALWPEGEVSHLQGSEQTSDSPTQSQADTRERSWWDDSGSITTSTIFASRGLSCSGRRFDRKTQMMFWSILIVACFILNFKEIPWRTLKDWVLSNLVFSQYHWRKTSALTSRSWLFIFMGHIWSPTGPTPRPTPTSSFALRNLVCPCFSTVAQ